MATVSEAPALEKYVGASWTHKDGLPSTLIYAITQTGDGYLWLGTSDGLVRFDGINFVHQRFVSNTDPLLGAVTALCATKDGALWVGSASGFVARMSGTALQKYRVGAEVEAIVQSPESDIWVIAQNGLFRFDENRPGELVPAARIDSAHLIRLLASSADQVSLGRNMVIRAAEVSGFASYERKVVLSGHTLFLKEQRNGNAWLGINLFERKENFSIVLRDTRGYLWAGSAISGLIRNSDEGRRLETELANDLVESLFEDREGNIWVGTNNGLSRFRFGKIFPFTKRDGLSSDRVSSVETTGSTVWVGTQTGLNRIDNLRVQQYLRGLDVLTVRSVKNQLWVGSAQGVFTVSESARVPQFQLVSRDLLSVTAIEEGSADCVWLLDAQKGLYRWKSGALVNINGEVNAGGKTITTIRAQNDGALWIGFLDGGLGIYKEGAFHEFSTPAGVQVGTVHDICVEKPGTIWLGTDTGLYRFDSRNFTVWNIENGLPGNRILWLQADTDDKLWLGFSTGVAELRRPGLRNRESAAPDKLQCDFYDSGDGLIANPVRRSQAAVSLDSEGKLWFTTSAGIAVMDPRHIEKNSMPPPVVIERVIADNRQAPTDSPLYFPPLTNNLQIDYAGLSLVVPRKVQFRYRLEGYDKGWQNVGTRRQAFYTNLQPGTYEFRVSAANNDGVWNENGASLNFSILPAFYQTRLFKILCIIAAAAIAWSFYRLRLQRIQAALNARFEERLAERTRIAQDLHDELLQSAMGVSLQIELTDALLEEPHAAKRHLQRALILSRELMQKGRAVLRDLREKARDAPDIPKLLSNTMEGIQRQGGPASRLTVEGQPRPLNPLIAEDFVQIGCQAIANAFQHATAKKIEVYLIYKAAELCLEVDDDGRGIEPGIAVSGRPGHYGLAGMRERAERIGGTLVIETRLGEGTKVKVIVPGKHAYREANHD
jgi:signal transduction histidine kinase/ligand-binding sensor domain-containing protein